MNDTKHNTKHEEHDDSEGHEHHSFDSYRMRLPSPLTPEAERVMSETIGSAIQVHRELGPGLLESIYRSAMQIELTDKGLSHETERPVCIKYRDIELRGQRVDLIVENLIVVELKGVAKLNEIHRAQVLSYLRATGLRGGLLINFHVPVLRNGLKRLVL
jgi:GxxExxY protein